MPIAGTDKDTPIPPRLDRWNWGAFFLNWIWGIGNSTYIALLMFVPLVNIVMVFVLGARGSRWAWRNHVWQDEAHFIRTQRNWARAGVIVLAGFLVLGAGTVFGVGAVMKNSVAYTRAMTLARADPRVVAAFGAPITAGWFPTGRISTSGSRGKAALTITLSGPDCTGDLVTLAEKQGGVWKTTLLVVFSNCSAGTIVLVNTKNLQIPEVVSGTGSENI